MNRRLAFTVTLLPLAWLAVGSPAAAPSAHWPGWRGPDGQGVSRETGLPASWSPATNIRWKTEIPGRGHSSPIVWGDRVFVTTDIEGEAVPGAKAVLHIENNQPFLHPDSVGGNLKHRFTVYGVDAGSGRILWERTAHAGTVYDDRHKRGSYAAPTPVTDGERVYAYFGPEGVYAYDLNGGEAWKHTSLDGGATFGMGTGTSPIIYRDLLVLQVDEDTGQRSYVVAYDRTSGREVWRAVRPVQASWATPVIVEVGPRTELVTSGNEFIIAYDPATGQELWRTEGVKSNAIPSPVVGHGLVIVSAGFPDKKVIAIRPGGSGDITGTDRIVWTYDKGTAYVASPILYGDYVYLTNDKGILTCLDARTGEVEYEGGRVPAPGTFFASMVAFEGRLLQISEDGDVFLVRAGPVHEVLHTNSMGEPVYASPAIAHGRLYIRGLKHLFAIGN